MKRFSCVFLDSASMSKHHAKPVAAPAGELKRVALCRYSASRRKMIKTIIVLCFSDLLPENDSKFKTEIGLVTKKGAWPMEGRKAGAWRIVG
jgi:hypothetical protein